MGRPADHDKPVEAGKGPARHSGCGEGAGQRQERLYRPRDRARPPMPAVRDRRRRRMRVRASHRARRRAVGHVVQPVRVLQRALHRDELGAPPDARRPRRVRLPGRFRRPVPALFHRQQRRFAHRGRLHPEPRPLPGRPPHVPHGGRAGRRDVRHGASPERARRHREMAAVGRAPELR